MEERKAAPVGGIEAAAQIVPALDLVHRLVGDDLLQDRRRRLPVDAAQHQEAAVEPRRQQMHQVAIDRSQRRFARPRSDRGAWRRSRRWRRAPGSGGGRIPGAGFRPPAAAPRRLRGTRRSKIGLAARRRPPRRRAAWCAQGTSGNARRSVGVERAVARQDLAGDGHARGLAATGDQRLGQLADVVLGRRASRASAAAAGGPARRSCSSSSCRKETFTGVASFVAGRPSKHVANCGARHYNNFAPASACRLTRSDCGRPCG